MTYDHDGDSCPVDPETYVRVEYRKPALSSGTFLPARLFNWAQHNAPSDIVKYEVKE